MGGPERFLRSPAVPVEGDLKAMPLLKASDAGSIKTLTEKVMLTQVSQFLTKKEKVKYFWL